MTDNRTTELLPCPFCGGEAEISHVRDICRDPQDWYWGKCSSCRISGNHYPTEAEAIAAWNTRATLGSEREIELGDALNEVAEKWAIAQVEAEDYAKRCMLLEELVRDMWSEMLTCPDYATSPCMTNSICERVRNLEIEVNL